MRVFDLLITIKRTPISNGGLKLKMALTLVLLFSLFLLPAVTVSATVRPYVLDNARTHERALTGLIFLSTTEPPEPMDDVSRLLQTPLVPSTELTLTQQILQQAEIEYRQGLSTGQQFAMDRMLGFLKKSGITQELADILVEDIEGGAYQADRQVIEGLKVISANRPF